jgi:hypothetical protein
MFGSNKYRVSLSLKSMKLSQRPSVHQPLTAEGIPAYETLLLQEGIQVELTDGVTVSRHSGSDPEISFVVDAVDRDQAWIQARPRLEILIAALTLALGRPLGRLDESSVFISPCSPSGLVPALTPNIDFLPTISEEQLTFYLRGIIYFTQG